MEKFEFIIDGPPVFQQARRRERVRQWKTYVREEAEKYWSTEDRIFRGFVMVRVIYFYDEVAVDIDNIVKPILDAIIGLVYIDDNQVTDIIVRKRNLFGNFKVKSLTLLEKGLKRRNEFLYISVTAAPNQETLT
ncbi:RusA family crossover junction endodeoxyribonuclease [Pleurocapsales cyanobacterium LEGE 10410]|nr:RusA family crossover junction endodeoxyribonuclease [Pleurocapsales cyanobacterium LEGE 10410]